MRKDWVILAIRVTTSRSRNLRIVFWLVLVCADDADDDEMMMNALVRQYPKNKFCDKMAFTLSPIGHDPLFIQVVIDRSIDRWSMIGRWRTLRINDQRAAR